MAIPITNWYADFNIEKDLDDFIAASFDWSQRFRFAALVITSEAYVGDPIQELQHACSEFNCLPSNVADLLYDPAISHYVFSAAITHLILSRFVPAPLKHFIGEIMPQFADLAALEEHRRLVTPPTSRVLLVASAKAHTAFLDEHNAHVGEFWNNRSSDVTSELMEVLSPFISQDQRLDADKALYNVVKRGLQIALEMSTSPFQWDVEPATVGAIWDTKTMVNRDERMLLPSDAGLSHVRLDQYTEWPFHRYYVRLGVTPGIVKKVHGYGGRVTPHLVQKKIVLVERGDYYKDEEDAPELARQYLMSGKFPPEELQRMYWP